MKLKFAIYLCLISLVSCEGQENKCIENLNSQIDKSTSFPLEMGDFTLVFHNLISANDNPNNDFIISKNPEEVTVKRAFLESDNLLEKNFTIQSDNINISSIQAITVNDYVFNGDEKLKKPLNLSQTDTIQLSCENGTYKIPIIENSKKEAIVLEKSVAFYKNYLKEILNNKDYSSKEKATAEQNLRNINPTKISNLADLFVSYENLNFDLLITYKKDDVENTKTLKFKNNNFKENEQQSIETNQVYVNNDVLIISNPQGAKEYPKLIYNGMSLNTSLVIEDDNNFYLIYEYTASANKRQVAYKYYHNENTFLIYKESISYGREGVKSSRIYFKNFELNNHALSDLEGINFDEKVTFLPTNSIAETTVFDEVEAKIATIGYSITNEERFLEFSEIKSANDKIKYFKVLDKNKINNLATSFEKLGINEEANFLFKHIE